MIVQIMDTIYRGLVFNLAIETDDGGTLGEVIVSLYNTATRSKFDAHTESLANDKALACWFASETMNFPLGVYHLDIYDPAGNMLFHQDRFAQVVESAVGVEHDKVV